MVTKEERVYRELLHVLSSHEQHFVREYLIHHNAAKAARKAGYSSRCAKEIAWENLTKPHISAAVEAGLGMIARRCELDAERVKRELMAVASSNIEHYCVDEEGYVVLEEGAPSEAIRAIQSVKRKKRILDDGSVVIETEYRLWDKIQAINLLGKRLKLWVDRIETENPQDAAYRELLKRLKEGDHT